LLGEGCERLYVILSILFLKKRRREVFLREFKVVVLGEEDERVYQSLSTLFLKN
jgi:hypothetical protein